VALLPAVLASSPRQAPIVQTVDESTLREYAGVYQWSAGAYAYLQLWDEFSGFGKPRQLVAFDEAGDVRTLYPIDRDRFFAGPGMALSDSVESRVEFQRDRSGTVVSMVWQRDGAERRTARRVEIERHEDVRFPSTGTVRLAGTLISPATPGKHPAVVLVHGSGAENRDYMLPWSRFLVRRGMAVLGYDKRGVNESTGDWNTASFPDLANDVIAAFNYLKRRPDIDRAHIGLLGISQAGWIMPIAAVRAERHRVSRQHLGRRRFRPPRRRSIKRATR
jgi:acetyl esterase/lipase